MAASDIDKLLHYQSLKKAKSHPPKKKWKNSKIRPVRLVRYLEFYLNLMTLNLLVVVLCVKFASAIWVV